MAGPSKLVDQLGHDVIGSDWLVYRPSTVIGQFKYPVLIRLFLVNFYSHQPFYLRVDSRSSVAYCDCWTVELWLVC